MTDEWTSIWRLPAPSQEFCDGPVVNEQPGRFELRYDFETDDGSYEWAAIVFDGLKASRFVEHSLCSPEQIKAYDTLVEVRNSDWRAELSRNDETAFDNATLYRIYFDEVGAFEVLAASWTATSG